MIINSVQSVIHSFIYSFIHSFIHSFNSIHFTQFNSFSLIQFNSFHFIQFNPFHSIQFISFNSIQFISITSIQFIHLIQFIYSIHSFIHSAAPVAEQSSVTLLIHFFHGFLEDDFRRCIREEECVMSIRLHSGHVSKIYAWN